MPIGPWLPAAIGAVGSLVNNSLGQSATDRRNRQERQWAEYVYNRQRKDALADRDWQTWYDSPQQQMARLKAAGLNPHLIYGGAPGNNSPTVRSSDFAKHSPEAYLPDYSEIPRSISSTYNLRMQEAQIKSMEMQPELIAAQILATLQSTKQSAQQVEGSEFDLDQKRKLAQTSIDMQNELLRKVQAEIGGIEASTEKTKVDTQFTLHQDVRAELQNASSLKEAAQRILKMIEERKSIVQGRELTKQQIEKIKVEIKNALVDGTIKNIDASQRERLDKRGITPGTPGWWNATKDAVGIFQEWLKDLIN